MGMMIALTDEMGRQTRGNREAEERGGVDVPRINTSHTRVRHFDHPQGVESL